jgi:hypothetical protein
MKKFLLSLLLFPSLLLGQFSGPSDSDTSDREAGSSLVWLGTPSNSSESVDNIEVGDTIVLGLKITSYNANKDSLQYAHIDIQIDKRLYTWLGQEYNSGTTGNSDFIGSNSKMQWNNNFDHYDIWDQWQNGTYVSDSNYEIHHLQTAHADNKVETLDWYVKFQLKVNSYDSSYDYTDGVILTMGLVSESIANGTTPGALDPLYAYPNQDFSNVPVQDAPTANNAVNDGPNAITYKSFKINDYANNNNQSEYNAHPASASDFDAMFDYANKRTTTWTHQGRETATKALTWPSSKLPRHNSNNFGWIIEGYFVPPTSGTYKFQLDSDDRSDFWFDANDNGTITNTGIGLGNGARTVDITNLTAGTSYKFRIRYEQGVGGADLYLKWKSPEDVAAGADWAFNGNTIYSIDADDYTVPIDYTVNYNFHSSFNTTDYSVDTYYESGTNEVTKNSNSQTKNLGANGSVDISDQIDTDYSKTQHVVFTEPSSTVLASTAAAVVTVADVYLAFQELTDRGINNDQSGNKFTYGIQYANANVDRDNDFDFDDTYMMLDWLNGGTSFSLTGLSSVMRLIETSTYNSVASSAVGTYSTQTMFPLGLTTGTDTYTKNITVTWLGDVNLSHSPTPTNNLSVTGMTINNAPTMVDKKMYISNAETIEFRIESEIKEDKVHYIVKGGFDGIPIGAVQLQLKYNKDKLQLSNNTFQTGGTDFINDQNGIISFGSLKIDDGMLNNLPIYEFIFTGASSEGSLGLILIEGIEAVTTDNKPVNILFQ